MKPQAYSGSFSKAFALPTILIASIVMLIILLASVTVATASRSALDSQYYDRLASEATESGLMFARTCIAKSDTAWTLQLKPNTDCLGIAAAICPAATVSQTGAPASCFVMSKDNIRTTFTVSSKVTDISGITSIEVIGTTYLLRTSNGSVWRTYTQKSSVRLQGAAWRVLRSGPNNICGIDFNYDAYCWGGNATGQLGDGTTTDRALPTLVSGGKKWVDISSGNASSYTTANTCAIEQTTNYIWCWGLNNKGQLGNAGTTQSSVPVQLPGTVQYSQVAVSAYHVCGLSTTGKAYCWGENNYGQLGRGTTTASGVLLGPVALTGTAATKTFTQLGIGIISACALASDTTVWCWGGGANGRLGNGSTANQPTAVQVTGLTAAQIEVGSDSACAWGSTGTAACWGYNNNGQLGNGTTTDSATFVTVGGGIPFESISVGGYFACGIRKTVKTLYCWGDGAEGQQGNGALADRLTPGLVNTPSGSDGTYTSIQSDAWYACAIDQVARVWCWGMNDIGQVGPTATYGIRVLSPVLAPRINNKPPAFLAF